MPSPVVPTVGVKISDTGGRDVFIPSRYTVGNFGYATTPGGTCNAGIPATGTTFYECDFENATGAVEGHPATSNFDRFGVPLMVLSEANTPTGCSFDTNSGEKQYSTISDVSEDNSYIALHCSGNIRLVHATGPSAGQSVSPQPSFGTLGTSNGEFRWLRGAHASKFFYKEGNVLRVYDVSTNRWCTDISTCSSTSEAAFHTSPLTSFGFGGNEGDVNPQNHIVLTKTGVNPAEVWDYDIPTKTLIQMASVPSGSLDHCEVSPDSVMIGCQISGSWYVWTRATGAIQNGGSPFGGTGHAAYAKKLDGTNIRITFNDLGGSPYVQQKSYVPWASTSFTNFFKHDSPRDPQASASDSHWSAVQKDTTGHNLVAFDLNSGGASDQVTVTAGSLNDPQWKIDWRYLSNEVVVCDYEDVAGNITTSPNCWRLAHNRTYQDNRDCQSCVSISADGQYVFYRSHLSTDVSGSGKRVYIIRAGPLFSASSVPTLTSITPASGVQNATAAVTLDGTNMAGASPSINVSGTGITVNSIVQVSALQWTANFVVAAGAATGQRTVSVTTVDGTSNTVTFTVTAAAVPTLSVVVPNVGVQGGAVAVQLFGTEFDANSVVTLSGTGITVSNTQFVNGTTVSTTLTLAAGATLGTRTVTVTTDAGASNTVAFTVIPKALVNTGFGV